MGTLEDRANKIEKELNLKLSKEQKEKLEGLLERFWEEDLEYIRNNPTEFTLSLP